MKHKESGLVTISPGSANQHFDDVLVDGVRPGIQTSGLGSWWAGGISAFRQRRTGARMW